MMLRVLSQHMCVWSGGAEGLLVHLIELQSTHCAQERIDRLASPHTWLAQAWFWGFRVASPIAWRGSRRVINLLHAGVHFRRGLWATVACVRSLPLSVGRVSR
jgi:hypothetical protein